MTQASGGSAEYPETLSHITDNMGKLGAAQPGMMQAFNALHEEVCRPGALDTRTKELMALGMAVALRCDGCIAFHTSAALAAGATREQVAETLSVAVLMGGGPAMVYATHVLDAVDQFAAAGPGA